MAQLFSLGHITPLKYMPFTNEQLSQIDIVIGRHLINVEEVLISVMETQADILKLLSQKLPDMSPEERKLYRDFHGQMGFALDQHRAGVVSFRESIENLANAK